MDEAGIDQPLQPPAKALPVGFRSLTNELGEQLSMADKGRIAHRKNHRKIAFRIEVENAPPQMVATFAFCYENFLISKPFHVTSHFPLAVLNSAPGVARTNVS